MNAFDVRIHAIRRRSDRRRPFEVRWHAAGLGPRSLAAGGRPGRPGGDQARGGGPGPAPGWEPGSGHDHHPQASCLPRLPQLRGRTRDAAGQPAGPHHLAAPEAVLPSEPEVSCQPGRGAGHPGRDHQDPSRADRLLRLPVLRGTAPRRSCRATRRFLRPATGRLGTADTHWIPPPLSACLDRQRHATRGPRPETPPGRR